MLNDYLDVAKSAAIEAGVVLLDHYGKPIHKQLKSDKSLVTEADLASDIVIKKPKRTIVDEILKAQAEVLGELRLEETEVEEIIIRRRLKKRTLSFKQGKRKGL